MLNLKCPNSQGGSALEEPRYLRDLLEALRRYPTLPPIFLKIRVAPEPERIDEIIEIAAPHPFVAGFYPAGGRAPAKDMKTPPEVFARTRGSITGPHTFETVNAVVAAWYARIDPARFQLISAGGVFSAEDAYQRIRWGASLVQIYTCLVYEGPSVVERIKRGLCELLERDGLTSVSQAVGANHESKSRRQTVYAAR
jgi:dihydroorotate dehydrogenase (fumarate)/dihydroorotate dehydrogenase